MLATPFTIDDIWVALNGMGPTKALEVDGFPTLFFKKCWNIVGVKVTSYCIEFFNEDKDIEPLNSFNIMLILKIPHPTNMVNFHLISLCNVLYKVIAKAVANRHQHVFDCCNDSSQSAFVPGCLISNNVLLAYQIMHTLRQKRNRRKGYMALKLDMSKEYDRVEWFFLKKKMME